MGIIYKTTNLIDRMSYISKDAKNNPRYLGSGILLKRAIKKHGRENFVKETIMDCLDSVNLLNEAEKFFIDRYNTKVPNGYNLTDGGDGMSLGMKRPEHAKRMKGKRNPMFGIHRCGKNAPMYGKHHTEKTIEIIRQKNTGKIPTKKSKEKMSKKMSGKNNPFFGKHHTEEAKRKNREAHLGEKNFYFGKKNPAQSERMKKNNPMKKRK